MAANPRIGIEQADRLIERALEQGLVFPASASRWRLLAWAAEELDFQRTNPTDWERGGFRRIFNEWFGPNARPT